ncbi:MAG: hypothetical protein WDN00_03500 [Limisphaerales bacterium]
MKKRAGQIASIQKQFTPSKFFRFQPLPGAMCIIKANLAKRKPAQGFFSLRRFEFKSLITATSLF